MILNTSVDWARWGEKTVAATLIRHFWTPDLIIHDLVQFKKPEVLKEVAALEIKEDLKVYYKIRWEVGGEKNVKFGCGEAIVMAYEWELELLRRV